MGYETVDISGDAGIRATGETLKDAFASAAEGMYSLITDLGGVSGKYSIEVSYESSSLEGLLVGFLNELVYLFDTYGFIGNKVEVEELGETRIRATVFGEKFDPERHARGFLIKAATYHNLKIEKSDSLWDMEIIFDI